MNIHPAIIPISALLLTIGVIGGVVVTYRSYKEEKVVAEAKIPKPNSITKMDILHFNASEMDKIKMQLREQEIQKQVKDIKFRQRIEQEKRKIR